MKCDKAICEFCIDGKCNSVVNKVMGKKHKSRCISYKRMMVVKVEPVEVKK